MAEHAAPPPKYGIGINFAQSDLMNGIRVNHRSGPCGEHE
jgi:hypothetical protein